MILANLVNRHDIWMIQPDHGPLFSSNLDTDIHEPYTDPIWPTFNEHLLMGGVSSGVFLDEESQGLASLGDFIKKPISMQVETAYTQEQYDVILV